MLNDLFWALYFIDVVSHIPDALVVGGLCVTLGALIVAVLGSIFISDRRDTTQDQDRRDKAKWIKKVVSGAIVVYIVVIAMAFIPSKKTMYLMLGTRMTDKALQTDMGKKMGQIVNETLDGYLEQLQQKKK